MQAREIKRHLDGRKEEFLCEAIYLNQRMAILRFETPPGHRYRVDASIPLSAQVTQGVFWKNRNYLLYKMFNADGSLLGYRFDICCDVNIGPDFVEWTDLVLDFWVDAQGEARLLDEEEVAQYQARGLLGPKELEILRKTKTLLISNYPAIIQEAESLLKAHLQVGGRSHAG